ncbi:MAG: glycosyltransferase family 2 protein [Gemmatimonadetes bacterium]|nr:glycosyltransferase family 2 protein [Gemmatimonadota bacterium]
MATPTLPFVSVIVPCRNEERFIRDCLERILATTYPHDRLEILVVDGWSDDATRAIIEEMAEQYPQLRMLDNARRITPAALNIAIRAAGGDLVVRMDAHAYFPPDYIERLVVALEETGADIVGGAIHTRPADDTATAQAIALAMQHPFGVGNSSFRIGTQVRRPADHVPFFACRRTLFNRVGLFDEELVRNQDGEFSWRVLRHGGQILLIPEARAEYFARDSLSKLARMFFQYGYYKVLTAYKVRRLMTVRQVIPPVFLLTLGAVALLALWQPIGAYFLLGLLATYAAAVGAASLHAGRGATARCAIVLLVVFPIMHFGHGIGQLRRAAELLFRVRSQQGDGTLVPLSR